MKQIFKPVLLMCFIIFGLVWRLEAQFGIGGRYSSIQDGYWQELFDGNYQDQVTAVYLMYWLRLKNKRVEFLPEVGYYRSLNSRSVQSAVSTSLSAVYVQINTDVYFLDLSGDCNCPTFSKEGDVIQRGLFAEVGTGVEFRNLEVPYLEQSGLSTQTFKRTVPKVYAGLGLDIGISDLITITPTGGVSLLPGSGWEGVEEFLQIDGSAIDSQGKNRDLLFNAGIRFLFRPDYLRKRR